MSRLLFAAALGAIGLFTFAAPVHAAAPTATAPAAHATATSATAAKAPAEASVRPWRASETIGLVVENPQGKDLGKIGEHRLQSAERPHPLCGFVVWRNTQQILCDPLDAPPFGSEGGKGR